MLRLASYSSSSKVLSGALRPIASSIITANAFTAASRHQLILSRKPPNFVSHCLSTDTNNSIDRNLVALKSEIKSHNLSLPPPQLPDDFPFTILEDEEEGDDDEFCRLTRELNGENIFVSMAMPKIIQEELRIVDDDDDEGSVCLPEPIRLQVGISMKNGKSLLFDVVICPHVLHVATLSLSEPQSDGQLRWLRCYVEGEGEGELQSTLQEYLEIRGIKTCYAEFMYRYMVWKSKHAALNTLELFKKFIKDS